MARFHLALLLLFVFLAVYAANVSAVDKPSSTTGASPPTATTEVDVAEPPTDDNAIGTTDDDAAPTPGDDDVAVAGPIGSDSSYANYPPPQQTSGSAVTTKTVGLAYAGAVTAASFFF